jgi:transposase
VPLRLRTSTNRRDGRTYRYYQLVRAVRRKGRPTQDVVAHLGQLSDAEANAMRAGLATLKANPAAADSAADDVPVRLKDVLGLGALRYLDLMVVRCMWNEWKLEEFFEREIPTGDSEVSPADVIFTLVANRCVAPCSKLRVTEWTPHTCLPQLLRFEASQLNNTRIHRVLDALEEIEPKLSRFIIDHPTRRRRPDSVVFLDLTNTWFEGHGGTLAERSKTKDGAIRRPVVQLALGVDAHGLPLQWEVLPGKTAEVNVLSSWIDSLGVHEVLRDLPLVFDRGLTSAKNLFELIDKKRRFVTCARESQIEKWKVDVDLAALSALSFAEVPDAISLSAARLIPTEDEDIYHVDQGVLRPPLNMTLLEQCGLRVVPYFRPSLFVRNRDSLERLCRNVEGKVAAINCELRTAQRTRTETAVRRKIDNLLSYFQVADEYAVRLEPFEIKVKTKPTKRSAKTDNEDDAKIIRSFQVALERVTTPSSRMLNAGWMILLAHPDDTRPALDLIRQYHQKEVVEHAFGIIKSVVDLRPVHHQTNQKIKAHVTLCVLALLLSRYLELKLHHQRIHMAVDRVYETLEPCRLHVLSARGRSSTQLTITHASESQMRILNALGLSYLAEQETIRSLAPIPQRRLP